MAVIDSTTVDARRPRRRRWLGMLTVALVGIGTAVGLVAGTASAAGTCTINRERSICLDVNGVGNGNFTVHVGVLVPMSAVDAQEYIDDPGNPIVVTIVADDGIVTSCPLVCGVVIPTLFQVPVTAMEASDEGLSAFFDVTVSGNALNEDPPGQEDEIRAIVELWDRDTNTKVNSWLSNQLSGNWPS
jgi:hypothetical protein